MKNLYTNPAIDFKSIKANQGICDTSVGTMLIDEDYDNILKD